MQLYLNYGFLRNMSYFFTEDRPLDDKVFHAFWKQRLALQETFAQTHSPKTAGEVLRFIVSSGYAHRNRYAGYLRLKNGLPALAEPDLMNLYTVLFSTEVKMSVSWPAYRILREHFAEIVLRIVKRNAAPVVFRTAQDVARFTEALFEALCAYVLQYCPSDDVSLWGERFYTDTEPQPPTQGYAMEEYENLTCYVHITDPDTVRKVGGAAYLAGYRSTDCDRGAMLVGGLITFASQDLSDALTLQIIGLEPYDSYEEMYHALGTAAFGCAGETPEACAAQTHAFLDRFYPEGPLALKVKRLSRPVLTKYDFDALKLAEHKYAPPCEGDTTNAAL